MCDVCVQVRGAEDCIALRELRGRDDFVVSPCYGVVGVAMRPHLLVNFPYVADDFPLCR